MHSNQCSQQVTKQGGRRPGAKHVHGNRRRNGLMGGVPPPLRKF